MAFNKAKVLEDINRYLQKGEYNKAIAEFDRMFRIDPKDYKLRQKFGDVYLRAGKKKEAIDQFELVAQGYLKDGFYLKSMAIYRQILRIEPTRYDIYEKLADLYKKQGLIGDAISNLRVLADAYEKQKKLNESMQVWEKIIATDPDNVIYRIKLIEFYLKQGLHSRAKEKIKQTIDYLKSKGRYDDIDNLTNKFPSMIEEDKEIGIQIARNLYNAGKFVEALNKLEAMISKNPKDEEAYSLKGHCYIGLGQLDKAKEAFYKSLNLNNELLDPKKGLLKVFIKEKNIIDFLIMLEDLFKQLIKSKQYDDAKAILDNFYVYLPNEKRIIKMYVELFRIIGDVHALVDRLKKLGKLYVEDNQIDDASACFKEILAIDPYEPSATEFFAKYKPKEEVITSNENVVFYEELEIQDEELMGIDKELEIVESHLKYGLVTKAKEKLEELSSKYSESTKVKELWLKYFMLTKDKEAIVLVLQELVNIYSSLEDTEKLQHYQDLLTQYKEELKVIDSNKGEKVISLPSEPQHVTEEILEELEEVETAEDVSNVEEFVEVETGKPNIEELFLEADFYLKNGLTEDALRKYHEILSFNNNNKKALNAIKEIEEKIKKEVVIDKTIEKQAERKEQEFFDLSKEILKELEAEETIQGPFKSEAEKITFEELLKEFKSKVSMEIDESDVETHYNLGIAYKEMGLLDDAIQEFLLTSRFLNKAYDSCIMIASCLSEKQDFLKAIEFYKKSLLMPDVAKEKKAGIYLEMGYLYESLKEIEKSLVCFKKAYDTDKNLKIAQTKIDELISRDPSLIKALENNDYLI